MRRRISRRRRSFRGRRRMVRGRRSFRGRRRRSFAPRVGRRL